MTKNKTTRRRFLRASTAVAGLVAGGFVPGPGQSLGQIPEKVPANPAQDPRAYGSRSSHEKALRNWAEGGGPSTFSPLHDQTGVITPSSLHYVFTRGITPPDINPNDHQLMIHGMVERPLVFSMEELKRLPSVSRIHFIECVANTAPTRDRWKWGTAQMRFGKSSCSEWTGVLLSTLLKEAGVKKGAAWLLAESADRVRHAMNITLEKAMDDALLAYGQNGEAIRPDQGYPLRLLAPGWEGVRNVKWLRRLQVGDQPFLTQIELGTNASLRADGKARWFNTEMGPKSVITNPSGEQQMRAKGFYEINGLAWSGLGTIRRVEISVDGGRNWQDAQLQQPLLPKAHTRFRLPWKWTGQQAVLQSRCTDDLNVRQPSLSEFAQTWGVTADYFQKTTNSVIHFNAIQPWRVNTDGSVANALWDA